MENLPSHILQNILSRLTESTALTRLKPTSKTFNYIISKEINSINLICTQSRYVKSRSPDTKDRITPFKAIIKKLIDDSLCVESVIVGIDKALSGIGFDDVEDEDESDDLYLCDVDFVNHWLLPNCRNLKVLKISDFWIQACWRKSEVLALVSAHCHGLCELEMKNAWLSVDGLNPMPTLTTLTLETIRLDDEDLSKVNQCFPCLQELNLIGVGGLKEPKIHLQYLKTFKWTVSNAPTSLAIYAPSLLKLELNCVEPRSLILETPLLSDLYFSFRRTNTFKVKELYNLKFLYLECVDISSVIPSFAKNSVKKLIIDSVRYMTESREPTSFSLGTLFDIFPDVSSLTLLSGAWRALDAQLTSCSLQSLMGMTYLKEIFLQSATDDVDITVKSINVILDLCPHLVDAGLLIHAGVDPNVGGRILALCKAKHPKIRWRLGTWNQDSDHEWVSAPPELPE